ncbi:MAG: hypothetical protein GX875_01860 [Propionibacterium sp.]|nr:hypothetical protein [Propionibacterium sp.]
MRASTVLPSRLHGPQFGESFGEDAVGFGGVLFVVGIEKIAGAAPSGYFASPDEAVREVSLALGEIWPATAARLAGPVPFLSGGCEIGGAVEAERHVDRVIGDELG